VWASEVAFNVRFRQGDVLGRLAIILQLAVFASLSAFTTDFDITAGILTGENKFEREADDIKNRLNISTIQNVKGHTFGKNRPCLNSRGISMTMGLSRLLLMAQYLIGILFSSFIYI
jgi:hypothetical protein